MSDIELVVVGTFLNKIKAELAQGALEAAEIESMVQSDDAGGMRPHLLVEWRQVAGPSRRRGAGYQSLEPVELMTKKIVSPSTYAKIADKVIAKQK